MQWVYLILTGLVFLGLVFRLASVVIASFNQCLAQIEKTLKLLRRLFRRSKSKRTPNPGKVRGRP